MSWACSSNSLFSLSQQWRRSPGGHAELLLSFNSGSGFFQGASAVWAWFTPTTPAPCPSPSSTCLWTSTGSSLAQASVSSSSASSSVVTASGTGGFMNSIIRQMNQNDQFTAADY